MELWNIIGTCLNEVVAGSSNGPPGERNHT